MSNGETNQTRDELNRITRREGTDRGWIATLAVAVLLASVGVALLEIAAWRQLKNSQAEFTSFRPEVFYLGNELQSRVTRMNAALLQFQLSKGSTERDGFHQQAEEVQELIAKTRPNLRTPEERDLAGQADTDFQKYLEDVSPLLDRAVVAVRRDSAARVQEQLDQASGAFMATARKLSDAQRASLDAYAARSLRATNSVRRTVQFSGIALILLVAAIALFIYRVMVTPLKARLDATRAVIERQHRLASLGTLATGVAHEIRNPLAAIKLRLFSLKKELADGPPREDFEVINSEISRLERIVKDFLQFARPANPALTRVTAQAVLHHVQALLSPQLHKSEIALTAEEANGVWLNADRQQLEQVLINLVQNAAESIVRSGSVTLRAREGISNINGQSGPVVVLEVSDTGRGIPRDAEGKIFDPFFSTKETGTGLGLSIAARIVELHGGFIQYQTHTGRGTTFSIVLPRPTTHDGTNTPH
jgi:signal transduction histidine kinase